MSPTSMNRRDSLKSIAALGAAGSLAGVSTLAQAQAPLTVGVIYVGPRDDFGYNQAHAQAAAELKKIAGVKGVHPMNTANIPGCTYCQPQVASIGLTEAAAKAKGLAVKVGKFPFIGNGKAIALGEPEGFIKTIFDAKTGELLGAHMIGAEVTELIQGYSVAKTLETTEAELMATVFPHPTLSEMMHESVLAAYGRTLHI